MDEPLAALDQARKRELLPYLDRLHEHAAIPLLYVTHDPAEAMHLGDHLVLLQRGQVLASGPLASVLTTRSEEHTSELQSLMRISYAVFCLKKQNKTNYRNQIPPAGK